MPGASTPTCRVTSPAVPANGTYTLRGSAINKQDSFAGDEDQKMILILHCFLRFVSNHFAGLSRLLGTLYILAIDRRVPILIEEAFEFFGIAQKFACWSIHLWLGA